MSKSYGKKSVKFRSLQSQAKKWESFASNLPAPLDLEQSVLSESSASDTETLSDLHQIENLLASVAIGDISPEIPVSSAAAVHSKLSAVASDALEMKNFDYKTDLNVPIDALDALFKLCQQSETCQLLLDDPPSLKIGEATYSDVYLLDSDDLPFPQAVKVIPLGGTDQLSIEEAILELQSTLSVANIKKCRSDTAAFHFVQLCK